MHRRRYRWVCAPPRTPPDIAGKLQAAIAAVLRMPDVAAKLQQRGWTVALGSRTRRGEGTVHFDWAVPESFEPACAGARAVYLIAPLGDLNPAPWLDNTLYVPDVAIGEGIKEGTKEGANTNPVHPAPAA